LAFIPAYQGGISPDNALAQCVTEYIDAGNVIEWAFATDFPAGMDVGGSAAMQKFFAGELDAAGLLEEINIAWMDALAAA
jgi:hypothetical protein